MLYVFEIDHRRPGGTRVSDQVRVLAPDLPTAIELAGKMLLEQRDDEPGERLVPVAFEGRCLGRVHLTAWGDEDQLDALIALRGRGEVSRGEA